MHQPDYRNYATGEFALPWTYLHAIKDYTDMAAHVESHPNAAAVFNFVPVLLDQLEDYAEQFATGRIRDPLLELLQTENLDNITATQRDLILEFCFRCNHSTMIAPYPSFLRLHELFTVAEEQGKSALVYLSGQYIADLLVWYHLAWMGESVRRGHELVIQLMGKGEGYTAAERRQLFELVGVLIQNIIPRYKKLREAGTIEISTTPYYHPIAPLLIDFNTARETRVSSDLPQASHYPGGLKRAAFHVRAAIESHAARFGEKPQGIWPAEGGVSEAVLNLFEQHGCHWTASGQGVLSHSLQKEHGSELPDKFAYLYRPYRVASAAPDMTCFFRDDRLSDLIGFEYARWDGRDAALNFIQALEDIYRHTPLHENPVVSVILDGENAWEYYPYNGHYFLSSLYDALENHPFIHPTTFQDYLALRLKQPAHAAAMGELEQLVAGSWVYGDFSTWIGSKDKNRAWDLLCAAKQDFDLVMAGHTLSDAEKDVAAKQLADCESSDWFWWFGDYNPSHSVESFDHLYRANLANLYRLLKLPAPATLALPISHGGGEMEAGGAMRRAS